MFALALAVRLTPELLPTIVTVTFGRGTVRMAQRRVIVKRVWLNLNAAPTGLQEHT